MAFNDINLITIDEGTSAQVTSDLNYNFTALKTAGENADTNISNNTADILTLGNRITNIEQGSTLGIKSITYGTGSSNHVTWKYRIITYKNGDEYDKYGECFGNFTYQLNSPAQRNSDTAILCTTQANIDIGDYPVTFDAPPQFYITPLYNSGSYVPISYVCGSNGTRSTPPSVRPIFNTGTTGGSGTTIHASIYAYGKLQ